MVCTVRGDRPGLGKADQTIIPFNAEPGQDEGVTACIDHTRKSVYVPRKTLQRLGLHFINASFHSSSSGGHHGVSVKTSNVFVLVRH